MIFKLGKYKHYKKILGRTLSTPDGRDLGRIISIKVGKKSGIIKSITYIDNQGNRREVRVFRILEISNGKVIADVELPKEEVKIETQSSTYMGALDISKFEHDKQEIKRRIDNVNEKYGKLLELLINKEIDISIYSEVKEKLDREKEEIRSLCERKIREIDDKIREIDYKSEDLKRRRSQLYVKKVLGGITPEEERELNVIDLMYREIEDCKKKLYTIRQELVSICTNI